MIRLQNNTSVVISERTEQYYPRKMTQFWVSVVPTPGKTAPDPDDIPMFGTPAAVHFTVMVPEERANCLALIGRDLPFIRQWVLGEWAKYQADQYSSDPQLSKLFDYVASVGLE